MLRLCSRISIIKVKSEKPLTYNLDFVDQAEVVSSWENICDTATITLPKKVYVSINNSPFRVSWENRSLASKDSSKSKEKFDSPLFEVGDFIKIELGYNGDLNNVFQGFISDVGSTVPIVLKCQDILWLTGKVNIAEKNFGKAEVTLSEVISFLKGELNKQDVLTQYLKNTGIKEIKFNSSLPNGEDVILDNYTIVNKTIDQVLQEIKTNYEIEVFSKENSIIYGHAYPESTGVTIAKKFGFQYNIIQEENFINKTEADSNIKVRAIGLATSGLSDKNEVVEISSSAEPPKSIPYAEAMKAPSKGEQIVTLKKQNIFKKALEGIALRKFQKIKYTGFSGSIVTFGTPFVKHGDHVEIKDNIMTDREGIYKAKRVTYTFGAGGFRQKIELHLKVS